MGTTTDPLAYLDALCGDVADAPTEPTAAEVAEALELLEQYEQLREVDALLSLRAAGSWRLCGALEQLRAEANAANPNRDRSSDGTIGDAAHAARTSRHNPLDGVVRALDLDRDGLDLAAAFERLRALAAAGKLPWLVALIYSGRIASVRDGFATWRVYTGPNPHVTHGHAETSDDPKLYDVRTPIGVFAAAPAPRPRPAPAPVRLYRLGDRGAGVAKLQATLRTRYPLYRHEHGVLSLDGRFGPITEAWVREFQGRAGLEVDGIAGPITLRALGL